MEGVDIILDLLKKDQEYFTISAQKFDSDKLATFLAVATYLASRSLSSVKVRSKQYNIKLKPIYSALKWDALGLTSLKSLTKFLIPLPKSGSDLVVTLWDAAKYIFFEVIWVTTTHVLERLAVLCFSPRIAWKLVRDVAASVTRMGVKGVSGFKYIFRAAKTTFLGNAIGALASWLVQVGLHIFRFFVPEKSNIPVEDTWERVWVLGKKILGTTVVCIISFIFACICAAAGAFIFGSIGTWIGAFSLPFILASILAILFCPTTGLLIGFAVGDFAGSALISSVLEKLGL